MEKWAERTPERITTLDTRSDHIRSLVPRYKSTGILRSQCKVTNLDENPVISREPRDCGHKGSARHTFIHCPLWAYKHNDLDKEEPLPWESLTNACVAVLNKFIYPTK